MYLHRKLIAALLLVSSLSYGQTIYERSPKSVIPMDRNAFFTFNMKLPVFADTTAANGMRYKDSLGLMVYIKTDSSVYVRSLGLGPANRWLKIGTPSGGSGVSSFNSRNGAVSPLVADYSAFYPLLSGAYTDPSWIATLSGAKISGTQTVTPGSTKVTIGGTPGGSVLQPFSVDIVPANILLSALGGQLNISQINATGVASSTTFLRGDGSWQAGAGGGGSPNTNVGTGYRWAIPSGNTIKTLFVNSYIIADSTSNSNGITIRNDTTQVATVTMLLLYGKLANPLSQFAATTSAQLAGVLSDDIGASGFFMRVATPAHANMKLTWDGTNGVWKDTTAVPGITADSIPVQHMGSGHWNVYMNATGDTLRDKTDSAGYGIKILNLFDSAKLFVVDTSIITPASLTSTYIGIGNASNKLSGSNLLSYKNTPNAARTLKVGELGLQHNAGFGTNSVILTDTFYESRTSIPSNSTFFGGAVGDSTATGNGNSGFGMNQYTSLNDGSLNSSLGYSANASVMHGSNNVGIGAGANLALDSGIDNIDIGTQSNLGAGGAGYPYGKSSNNIFMGNDTTAQGGITGWYKVVHKNATYIGHYIPLTHIKDSTANFGTNSQLARLCDGGGNTATMNSFTTKQNGSIWYNTDSLTTGTGYCIWTTNRWINIGSASGGGASGIADPGGSNNDILQRKAGAWTNRTPAQVDADLGVDNATVQTLTDAATITWDVSQGVNSQVTIASTGRTLSITNPVAGHYYTCRIIQGSGGSKTITTWPTNTKWPSGTSITLSTLAAAYDIVCFYYDGTNYYATYQNAFN